MLKLCLLNTFIISLLLLLLLLLLIAILVGKAIFATKCGTLGVTGLSNLNLEGLPKPVVTNFLFGDKLGLSFGGDG